MIFTRFRARVTNDTLKPSMSRNAYETRVLFGGLNARETYTAAITLMASRTGLYQLWERTRKRSIRRERKEVGKESCERENIRITHNLHTAENVTFVHHFGMIARKCIDNNRICMCIVYT